MRPQTIRRLLVFAVCCAGVAALYFVPGTAESPNQVATRPEDQPEPSTRTVTERPTPSPSASRSASATPAPTTTVTKTATASPDPDQRTDSPEPSSTPDDPERTPSPRPSNSSTPTEKPSNPESSTPEGSEPPKQVTGLHELESTYEELTIGWNAAEDDQGIKKYNVYLNDQLATAQHPDSPTEGTVPWWNSEDDVFFVEVAAVDTHDQEGKRSEALTVKRPPALSPSPDPPGDNDPPESNDPPPLPQPPVPTTETR